MSLLPDLDEELQARLLAYVCEPKASASCHSWRDFLYDSLHLGLQSAFYQMVRKEGKAVFCYNAVRPLAEDFEESVGYNFVFEAGGTYRMQWCRTFDAWSSQSEQQFGRWQVLLDGVMCESLEPNRKVGENEVRFAPAGYRFRIPIADILTAGGTYYTVPAGAPVAEWEMPARTGREDKEFCTIRTEGTWEAQPGILPRQGMAEAAAAHHVPFRADARFVDIDGEMHEVSGDIVANWPEHEWPRLMRCRLRWGING